MKCKSVKQLCMLPISLNLVQGFVTFDSIRIKEQDKDSELVSFAEALPSGLAISGEGGLSQAKPLASAIVGKDGVAYSAPSATAIAGASNAPKISKSP